MEELGVRPDEDTVWRFASSFHRVGQGDKQKLVLEKFSLNDDTSTVKVNEIRVRKDAWYEAVSSN